MKLFAVISIVGGVALSHPVKRNPSVFRKLLEAFPLALFFFFETK